jgi:hypothetical protein
MTPDQIEQVTEVNRNLFLVFNLSLLTFKKQNFINKFSSGENKMDGFTRFLASVASSTFNKTLPNIQAGILSFRLQNGISITTLRWKSPTFSRPNKVSLLPFSTCRVFSRL